MMDDEYKQETNVIKTLETPKKLTSNINDYLQVTLLSIIIYLVMASLMNIAIAEIVDLEIPIIVALSLILSYFASYNKIVVYTIFSAATILTLILFKQYAFFLIIVLSSELIVLTIRYIFNNPRDY